MVSSLKSISFRCNLRQSQILPWIFHSDAPFRCLIFPSPSLLRVMLTTMDLVLSSFNMNIPWHSSINPFLERIYPPHIWEGNDDYFACSTEVVAIPLTLQEKWVIKLMGYKYEITLQQKLDLTSLFASFFASRPSFSVFFFIFWTKWRNFMGWCYFRHFLHPFSKHGANCGIICTRFCTWLCARFCIRFCDRFWA